MITLRLAAASLIAVVFAACGGGSVATTPVPAATAAASAAPTVAPTSATLPVGAATAQALPVANGSTATVNIASSSAPAGASVLVTASAAPPTGIATISALRRSAEAITRTSLAYFTFVPSVDIQLTNLPTITISFPTNIVGPDVQIHEAFLDASTSAPVYTYDIANGKSGATFTATPLAPKILAGKSYIFVFYIETGTAATATPSPSATATATASATATPTPVATSTAVAAAEVTVPATISNAAVGINYTSDPNFFTGLAGTHVFGRGGLAAFNGGTPALVTDCRVVLGSGSATVTGGGVSVTAPFISTNPSVQTAVIGSPDSLHVGGVEQITLYDANGSAIGLFFAAGRITAVSAGKTGVSLSCSTAFGTNITTDRSLDTIVFSAATISTLTTRAGTANPSTITNIAPSDLGGAAGTVNFGRGTLTNSSGVTTVVTDCMLTLTTGGTVTLTGGTFSSTATFAGSSIDKLQVVAVQGNPTQFGFQPQNGKILMIANNFGYIQKAQSTGTDLSQLVCPL